ncbi:unnamed protein product [Notodromas monacha]|uniref:Uncharacterized protein n=1 Tax=Notodromas monacha TaxID=399045 RepID=A0A7R9GHJ5_9CRUS|nr:unnamed protein product [Notodromas monacha]CAG0921556.1 unnamed protein product [Notodromas monacha]
MPPAKAAAVAAVCWCLVTLAVTWAARAEPRRPPWANNNNQKRSAEQHVAAVQPGAAAAAALRRLANRSSAQLFVRDTYRPRFQPPISIETPNTRIPSVTSPKTTTTTTTTTTASVISASFSNQERQSRRKRVKLIRFIDKNGRAEVGGGGGGQAPVAPVTDNDLLTLTPMPDTDQGADGSKPVSSNSLLDIGKPGNPYELIQVAFPPESRIKPHPVTTNELLENDLEEFDPHEVYFTDGNLLVLRGGSFPKNYQPADPGPPIDNFRAPAREPKLPPGGPELGGLDQVYPDYVPGVSDPFGKDPDPLARNITALTLCPITGPCRPLLFPPLLGEHPPPDGVRPITLLHPDVRVSKLAFKPADSVYEPDAHLYTYYAAEFGAPKIVDPDDPHRGVDAELRSILDTFFPQPDSKIPESVGTPVQSNVPRLPVPPKRRPPPQRPRPVPLPSRPPPTRRPTQPQPQHLPPTPALPPPVTVFPPPTSEQPPKKIYFPPDDEMFQFPEIVTRRPGKPSKKPVFFPTDKTRDKTKFEEYLDLLGAPKVTPWVPKVARRRPDSSVSSFSGEPMRGPNPQQFFHFPQQQQEHRFRDVQFPSFSDSTREPLFHEFPTRRPEQDSSTRVRPISAEDFGGFFATSTPKPSTYVSLLSDINVNYQRPLPSLNPNSESIFKGGGNGGIPRISQLTPFESAWLQLQAATRHHHQHAAASQPYVVTPSQASLSPLTAAAAFPTTPFVAATTSPVIIAAALRATPPNQSYVRYLFQMGAAGRQPLVHYSRILGKRKR